MALTFDQVQNETIAAIATAMSESGIGIIRVSGPESALVVSKIYRNAKMEKVDISSWNPGVIRYGFLVENGEIIDEVMVSWMRAPHSYTTEDTVEINTHGGMYLMQRVLKLVLQNGARMADPGEFTKRAFLGGRIDLARAEAVMNLISSQNEFARKTSIAQLEGSVSSVVRELREVIIYEIAFIESALDDPENYDLDGYPGKLYDTCTGLEDKMRKLIQNAEDGRILGEGIRTVIAGRPNAGKSSLLNFFAGEDRAIVTDVAGTTRDTLSETVKVGDVILRLTDTAGIHDTQDAVEMIGVERARRAVQDADLILFVVDGSRVLSEEDGKIAQMITEKMKEGSKCIVLLNKSDLIQKIREDEIGDMFNSDIPSILSCSLQTGEGLQVLQETIQNMFHIGEISQRDEVFLTNVRHKDAMSQALESILLVKESILSGMTEDFFSIDLMNAYASLGKILGEAVEDDLVEEIFTQFCLGK